MTNEELDKDLENITDIVGDKTIMYASREAGIKSFAETYSFNIESILFNQLTLEQQELWRKEIENAVISGGEMGLELADDKRYDKELGEDLEEEIENFIKENFAIKFSAKDKIKADIRYIARHFAKWQHGKDFDDLLQSEMKFPKEFYEKGRFDMRDEMMKDAVGGEYWDGSIYLDNRPTEYKDGDKVKIIIIKEEQE